MSGLPVVWVSLDPVRKIIDFYPQIISMEIEYRYNLGFDTCILGSKFYHATIHFMDNNFYQTTPPANMGMCGIKSAGYRSVERIELSENNINIVIYGKQYGNEWRTVNRQSDSEYIFDIRVPTEVIINTKDPIIKNYTYFLSNK